MTRRILALVACLFLMASPAAALTDEDFAELTGRQVTLDVQVRVAALAQVGDAFKAPYTVVAEFLGGIEDNITRVEAITFPECLHLYRDTLLYGLALMKASIEVVGKAAGMPEDEDRAAFSAIGPLGYSILTEDAPAILAVAECGEPLPDDVA